MICKLCGCLARDITLDNRMWPYHKDCFLAVYPKIYNSKKEEKKLNKK